MHALNTAEQDLTHRIRRHVEKRGKPELLVTIDNSLRAINALGFAAEAYPSPLAAQTLGSNKRNLETLLASLSKQNTFSIEMALPTRASIAHALIVARLNFFRMLRHVLEHLPGDIPELPWLMHEVDENIADFIAMRATEEILKAIVSTRHDERILRERAAVILLHLWEGAATVDTGDLLPVLVATWNARRRVSVTLGTMLGASELFSLLVEGCDQQFLDFLTRPDCSEEEINAFQEFLFGLSIEELHLIEKGNPNTIVTPTRLVEEGVLTQTQLAGLFQAGDEAENFYYFFMKRHLMATYRNQMHLPGPKKTAEQYVLSHLLLQHWDAVGVRLNNNTPPTATEHDPFV